MPIEVSPFTTTGQWSAPMKLSDVQTLAKTSCILDPQEAVKATITAAANASLVQKKMFAPDQPASLKWTIHGESDPNYPMGHTPDMFADIAKAFQSAGYNTSFGPSAEYEGAYELSIREPSNG